jgi:cytosine permease
MRLGSIKLTIIQLGGLICMPSLLAGYMLAVEHGFGSAISALFVGNFILLILSLGMLKLTMTRRLTTAEYVCCILGPAGEKLCALA